MLVITRSRGQSFTAGNIKVTVLQNDGGQVRIGIAAPPDVKILRDDAKVRTSKR